MSNHSVIEHRANYHYVKVEEDYIAICLKGKASPHCKALILSILEQWTNTKRDKHEEPIVYMTYPQWIKATYWYHGRNVIIESLQELVDAGFITRKPYHLSTGKDTFAYVLNVETVQEHIKQLPDIPSEGESFAPASLSAFAERKKATDEHKAITQEMLAEKVIAPKITLPSKQKSPSQSQVSGPPDNVAPPAQCWPHSQTGAGANRRGNSNHRPVRIEKPQLTLQGEQARTYYEQVRGKKLRMTDNNIKACNSLGENEDTTFENLRDTITYLDNHELVIERGLVVDMQSLARDDYYFNFERSLTIVERNRKARKNGKSAPSKSANELPEFTEEEYQRLKETPA